MLTIHPFVTKNYISICVTAPDFWTLTETRKYCPDTILHYDIRDSLYDCKKHCETNGAKRLTFYTDNSCRCCTASSELLVSGNNGQIYTLLGKYIYLPTRNWCPNNIYFTL